MNTAFTTPTGDPFADIGGLTIQYLMENEPTKGKDLPELIEWLTDKYVRHWDPGKLSSYFLNSTITQGAYKGEEKVVKTLGYFNDLLKENLPGKQGWCRITGQYGTLFPAGRDNHILGGSGTFINFHSGFEQGLFLSKEAIVRMFAVPFGTMQLGDRIGLTYTNVEAANGALVAKICRQNIADLASGVGQGICKSEFTNPTNAVFGFAQSLIDEFRPLFVKEGLQMQNVQINLLHFTNFGTGPDIQLYTMPGKIFRFYSSCLDPKFRTAWEKFVHAQHRSSKYKDAQFDPDTQTWVSKKETLGLSAYQNWRNPVYQNLLAGLPILGFWRKWCKSYPFPFELIRIYLIELCNMEKNTIDLICRAADFIVNDDNDNIKKALVKINGAKYPHQLRSFFTSLEVKNYKKGAEDPLFTVTDFTEYLFGDVASWREIRDILLIAIYQKLHEQKKSVQVEESPEEDDDFDTQK